MSKNKINRYWKQFIISIINLVILCIIIFVFMEEIRYSAFLRAIIGLMAIAGVVLSLISGLMTIGEPIYEKRGRRK